MKKIGGIILVIVLVILVWGGIALFSHTHTDVVESHIQYFAQKIPPRVSLEHDYNVQMKSLTPGLASEVSFVGSGQTDALLHAKYTNFFLGIQYDEVGTREALQYLLQGTRVMKDDTVTLLLQNFTRDFPRRNIDTDLFKFMRTQIRNKWISLSKKNDSFFLANSVSYNDVSHFSYLLLQSIESIKYETGEKQSFLFSQEMNNLLQKYLQNSTTSFSGEIIQVELEESSGGVSLLDMYISSHDLLISIIIDAKKGEVIMVDKTTNNSLTWKRNIATNNRSLQYTNEQAAERIHIQGNRKTKKKGSSSLLQIFDGSVQFKLRGMRVGDFTTLDYSLYAEEDVRLHKDYSPPEVKDPIPLMDLLTEIRL